MRRFRNRNRPSLQLVVLFCLLAFVAGLGVTWSITTVLGAPDSTPRSKAFLFATARQGQVGESISVSARAERPILATLKNQRAGIVTSVTSRETAVSHEGVELYRVDLRPVIAAPGAVPAFRELRRGERGPDIQQFQGLLKKAAFYTGPLDGRFEGGTETATQRWQTSLGVTADGIVHLGDIVFTGGDDGVLQKAGSELAIGNSLVGGEDVFSVVAENPEFSTIVTAEQAASIGEGKPVIVKTADHEWKTTTTLPEDHGDGGYLIRLANPDGRAVCGRDCRHVPLLSDVPVQATIQVVPPRSGVVVPTSALQSTPKGSTRVHLRSGETIEVTVVASAAGQSVVDGVRAGSRVRIGPSIRD